MNESNKCRFMPIKGSPWPITVEPLMPFDPIDYKVSARGSSFHIIIGQHSYGLYLCIPNWGIGMDIADPDDCFWNYERVCQMYPEVSRIDAISIANALWAIKHYSE